MSKSNTEKVLDEIENGTIKKIKKEDNFTFGCDSCGKCCRNREDIILSPHDIFRLLKHLNISDKEFMDKYVAFNIGPHSGWTILTLKYKQKFDGSTFCPFLKAHEDKFICNVHAAKPYVCVAYPLGRMTKFDVETKKHSEIEYILQPIDCGTKDEEHKAIDWLRNEENEESEAFFKRYNDLMQEVREVFDLNKLRESKNIGEDSKRLFYTTFLSILYLNYDLEKSFLEQFEERAQELVKMISGFSSLLTTQKIKL
jgi:Fe-S-cluster containining protein